jgi:hypothetical protein
VTLRRPLPTPALLAGIGVSGAPVAWALQFWVGFSLGQAACNGPGRQVHFVGWTRVATVSPAFSAAVAGLCAVLAFRATREVQEDDAPPPGRIHFMAIVGMAITPLFLFIILMSGFGSISLQECRQS